MRRGLGSQVRVPADSRRSPAAAWRLGPLWGHKGGRPKGRRGLSGAWPLACEAGRSRLAVFVLPLALIPNSWEHKYAPSFIIALMFFIEVPSQLELW